MEFLMRFNFLQRLFGGTPQEDSRAAAKDRLRNALVGDRCTVAPALIECMSADILDVLKKYLVVDKDLKVAISEREGGMKLTAGVGVVRVLRQAQLPSEALVEALPEKTLARRHKLRGPRRRSQEGSIEELPSAGSTED